jgi:alkylation response protein AidB-like acyl-CoA dehydrogenase
MTTTGANLTNLTNITNITTGAAGGRFLVDPLRSDEIFTREDLTEEQRLFGQTAAEFIQKEVLPVVKQLYAHDWALTRRLLKRASELDLLRLEVPPAYGGLGLDLISASYVGEQLAVDPSFGGSLGAHTSIGTLPLVYFGNDEQKARYLPRLGSGELIGAYALTEPQAGSDALASRTTATLTPDGRHYLLNGQKMWITNGGFADLFTIFAKVNGEQFTAFLVERSMGVVSGRDEIKLGLDGSSTTALMLDNVKVPVENVLGPIGQGHKVALNVLNFGRVKLGSRNMSGVKLALGHAVKYAKDRRQFGRSIAEFGLIKEKLAGMAVRAFVGDAMSYRTLGEVDRALDAIDRHETTHVMKTIEGFAVECSINKVWTSEALAWAVDQAVQVFGGNGYSREFPVERMYRDARITHLRGHERDQPHAHSDAAAQTAARGLRRPRGTAGLRRSSGAGGRSFRCRARRGRPREDARDDAAGPGVGQLRRRVQGGTGNPGGNRRHPDRGLRRRERGGPGRETCRRPPRGPRRRHRPCLCRRQRGPDPSGDTAGRRRPCRTRRRS